MTSKQNIMKHLDDSIKGLTEETAIQMIDILKKGKDQLQTMIDVQLKTDNTSMSGALIRYGELQKEIQSVLLLACEPDTRLIPYIDNDGLRMIADRIMIMREEIKKLREENESLKQKQ